MDKITEQSLKADAFKWAQWEYQHDFPYWRDRAQNGIGLIKQIAAFVLSHGQAQGAQK
jgi:hypothetical protein